MNWNMLKIFLAFAAGFLIYYFGSRFLPGKKPNVIQPTPTPVVTSVENMRVTEPVPNQTVGKTIKISGEARVFENQFAFRVSDDSGKVLKEGNGYANAPDTGQYGPFEISTDYLTPTTNTGRVEVFEYSAKDGSEINKVTIPVTFPPGS